MSRGGSFVEIVGTTDRGRLRKRNEDSVAVDAALGAGVVADGMGGLQDGHLASRDAVELVMAHLKARRRPLDTRALEEALSVANDGVRARARAAAAIMGTTAVVLSMDTGCCRVAHAGDSRAYRFRDGELTLLTRDHSMVQEMVEHGLLTPDAARTSPRRNVITRALGLEPFEPASMEFDVSPGELLLLCSDGLWDMLEDSQIAALLARCGEGLPGLEACAQSLVRAANEAGGLDNISVVLART